MAVQHPKRCYQWCLVVRTEPALRWTCCEACIQRLVFFFFFQAEDGIRDYKVTGVQTCALPIYRRGVWVDRGCNGEFQVQAGSELGAGESSGKSCEKTVGKPVANELVRQCVQEIGRASCRERV